MLLGEFEHSIDEKNRLTLPARFRQALSGGVVVTRGLEPCLDAYGRDDWERLVESRLAQLDPFSREARMMQRHFFSGAVEGEPDKQGRITLSPAQLEHAGVKREVVVVGMRDHLEIWDRAAWREHMKEVEGSAEHVAERLAARGS